VFSARGGWTREDVEGQSVTWAAGAVRGWGRGALAANTSWWLLFGGVRASAFAIGARGRGRRGGRGDTPADGSVSGPRSSEFALKDGGRGPYDDSGGGSGGVPRPIVERSRRARPARLADRGRLDGLQ
jgi:hypothetical protein